MKRKVLAMILSVVMLVANFPIPVLAQEDVSTGMPSVSAENPEVGETVDQPAGEPADEGTGAPAGDTSGDDQTAGTSEEGNASPEDTTNDLEGDVEPVEETPDGTMGEEPGVETPDETAGEEAGSETPDGTTGEEPGSETPDETTGEEPGSETPDETTGETDETETPEDGEIPEESDEPEVEPLEAALSVAVRSAFAGDAVALTLNVSGGFGETAVVYEVSVDGAPEMVTDPKSVVDGVDTFVFTPAKDGEYTITAVVTDEAEQVAQASAVLPVAAHDTTSLAYWTSLAKAAQLQGDWRTDLVAVAKTQLGYEASATDFVVLADGSRQPYTVYGDWYGANYENWNTKFIAFSMEQAAIPASAFPRRGDVAALLAAVQSAGLFASGSDYAPAEGDIVFLANEQGQIDRAGIVTGATESGITTIEGGETAVVGRSYMTSDPAIMGYASMEAAMVRAGVPVAIADEGIMLLALERTDASVASVEIDGVLNYFDTLAEAITNVPDGGTITLLKSFTENVTSAGKNYTLDMAGFTIDGQQQGTVYTISGGTVTIKGGTITGGQAANGAGMYISGGEVTLIGMNITNNVLSSSNGFGGGLYVTGASTTLYINPNDQTDPVTTISNNTAGYGGGGIYLASKANAEIKNTKVTGNNYTTTSIMAKGGGGIYTAGATVTLSHVELSGNTGTSKGAAYSGTGADKVTFNDCTFSGNKGPDGGAVVVYLYYGGTYAFNRCSFERNTDGFQHIFNAGSENDSVVLDGCTFTDNVATGAAGIYCMTNVTVKNSLFTRNVSTSTSYSSGGIYYAYQNVTLENVTITGNQGNDAGGLYASGGSLTMTGSAIYGNTSSGSAQDILLYGMSLPAASTMEDHHSSDAVDFSDYIWLDRDSSGVVVTGHFDAVAKDSQKHYLTALKYSPNVAQNGDGGKLRTLQDAVDAAGNGASNVIKIVAGEDGEAAMAMTTTVQINKSITIDLNGRTITSDPLELTHPGVLFVVNGGDLNFTGNGALNGTIWVESNHKLRFGSQTDSLNIVVHNDAITENGATIEVAEGFSCSGIVEITLPEENPYVIALNETKFGDDDVRLTLIRSIGSISPIATFALVGGRGEVSTSKVRINGITNPRVVLEIDDEGNLVAVNRAVEGIFVSSGNNAADGEDAGTPDKPFMTLQAALDRLAELYEEGGKQETGLPVIYIVDESDAGSGKGITVSEAIRWPECHVTIERYSGKGVASGNPLITLKSEAQTLDKVTINGKSYSEDGNNRRTYTNCGPLVRVESSASLTIMGNALLRNNDSSDSSTYAGGAISAEGNVTMSGGVIEDCTAKNGGGIYIRGCTFTMTDGTIQNNAAKDNGDSGYGYGGGVFVYGTGKMVMTGGKIEGNKALTGGGGGVALGNGNTASMNLNTVHTGLEMSGGSFIGNTAYGCGGGLYVQCTFNANITAGTFDGNVAQAIQYASNFGGGAIYVNGGRDADKDDGGTPKVAGAKDGQLHLSNVLISRNTGTSGAGLAGCNTSTVNIYVNNGSFIYGNFPTRYEHNDILISNHAEMETSGVGLGGAGTIMEAMLDGTPYNWKRSSNNQPIDNNYLQNRQSTKIFYTDSVPSSTEAAKIFITNNTSNSFGGGIGTNGEVHIGTAPTPDQVTSITVTKQWTDGDLLKSSLSQVNIWLFREKDGKVERMTMGNLYLSYWRSEYTFKQLDSSYTYTVVEEGITQDGVHIWSAYARSNEAVKALIEAYMDAEGLEMIWSDDANSPFSSSVAEDEGNFTLTNTPVGSLSITKTISGNATTSQVFTFTVALNDTSVNGVHGDMEFTDGKATVKLKQNETKTATGLPVGAEYTVTEATDDSYQVVTPASGEAKGEIELGKIAEVTFENEMLLGNLRVSKLVESAADETGKKFTFTVTLGEKLTGTYGAMKFTNGVATFELASGETKNAYDLPAGLGYTVEETADELYTHRETGNIGSIVANETTFAIFVNTRKTGDLEITKTVVSAADESKKVFTFTVTLDDETITGEFEDMTFTDGVATVELFGGETKKASGLPAGIGYTVEEAEDELYTTEQEGENGSILADETVTASFTNTRKIGDLEITKTVVSAADESEKVFTFTVTLDDETITGEFEDMTFTDGVATVELFDGETKKATGLPAGIGYTVEEAEDELYTTEQEGENGSILADETVTASFTNTRKTGDLTVTKTVTGTAGETDKDFTFQITLTDTSISGTFGDLVFTSGVSETFTLKHGESKTITGLPMGVGYTVEESDNEGYEVTSTGETGTIDADETAIAEFTNHQDLPEETEEPKDTPEVTEEPTVVPTDTPVVTDEPTTAPTDTPVVTDGPTTAPTDTPVVTDEPTAAPTDTPVVTDEPTTAPTDTPVATDEPTTAPTDTPVVTDEPTTAPTDTPTAAPTDTPVLTDTPTTVPTDTPTTTPTNTPAPTDTATPVPTPEQQYISVAGHKTWIDQDNASGLRPESVQVRLLQNGNLLAERTVSEADDWSYSFDQLPMYDENGKEYTYTVTEQIVHGYYTMVDGYDLTNVLLPHVPEPEDESDLDILPPSGFSTLRLTTEQLQNMIQLFEYGVPLYGVLLGTGLEIPAYPFIFAGAGCLALLALALGWKKRKK